ncbi:MAG: hypothetical protein QMD88_03075 [Coprothermobacterota bacterium]|nr:hypothetical protein [Coprothermobacterota bacterium]
MEKGRFLAILQFRTKNDPEDFFPCGESRFPEWKPVREIRFNPQKVLQEESGKREYNPEVWVNKPEFQR